MDAQYWQFIGTPESFVMKSKLGNYIYYKGDRFETSATEKTDLDVFKSGEGHYEIGRTTTSAAHSRSVSPKQRQPSSCISSVT